MITQRTRIYQIAMELEHVTANRETYSWEAAEIDHIILRLKKIGDQPMPVVIDAAPVEQADDPEPHDQTFHGPLDEYERAHDEWLQRNPRSAAAVSIAMARGHVDGYDADLPF
jgi:hypothetical protein